MKTLKTGLISAGGVSKLFLARMPAVLRSVGPVKATSFRVARRIANSLRAGRPVESYADLNQCALVWIALPEAAVDRVLREFSSETRLDGKIVVVCGDGRDSTQFDRLAAAARLATLDAIPGEERVLVGEGDPTALREIRRFAAADHRRLIEVRAKPLYTSGVHLASTLLLPYFSAAVEVLRDAGFSRSQATHIAEGLGLRTLRSYAKAGRKAWSVATALDLRLSRDRDLTAVCAADPVRAAVYEQAIQQALQYFKG